MAAKDPASARTPTQIADWITKLQRSLNLLNEEIGPLQQQEAKLRSKDSVLLRRKLGVLKGRRTRLEKELRKLEDRQRRLQHSPQNGLGTGATRGASLSLEGQNERSAFEPRKRLRPLLPNLVPSQHSTNQHDDPDHIPDTSEDSRRRRTVAHGLGPFHEPANISFQAQDPSQHDYAFEPAQPRSSAAVPQDRSERDHDRAAKGTGVTGVMTHRMRAALIERQRKAVAYWEKQHSLARGFVVSGKGNTRMTRDDYSQTTAAIYLGETEEKLSAARDALRTAQNS